MDKKTKEMIDNIALILLVIGGLNWGLALFNFNLVAMLLGDAFIAKLVYGLVGASAIWVGWNKWFNK